MDSGGHTVGTVGLAEAQGLLGICRSADAFFEAQQPALPSSCQVYTYYGPNEKRFKRLCRAGFYCLNESQGFGGGFGFGVLEASADPDVPAFREVPASIQPSRSLKARRLGVDRRAQAQVGIHAGEVEAMP